MNLEFTEGGANAIFACRENQAESRKSSNLDVTEGLNQAPIPSYYLVSCWEAYTAAPDTINPILCQEDRYWRVVSSQPVECAAARTCAPSVVRNAAVSHYFACWQAPETVRYMSSAPRTTQESWPSGSGICSGQSLNFAWPRPEL